MRSLLIAVATVLLATSTGCIGANDCFNRLGAYKSHCLGGLFHHRAAAAPTVPVYAPAPVVMAAPQQACQQAACAQQCAHDLCSH